MNSPHVLSVTVSSSMSMYYDYWWLPLAALPTHTPALEGGSVDIKQAVGKRIKRVRQRNGLTQDELAEKVSLSPKYISGIERGVENPTMDNLIRLAKALDVEPYDLFLFGESEDSEKALRKGIDKMVREASREKLQLYFDVMRKVIELS